MLSVVRTSAKRRRPQRPEFADTTVWGVASFVSRLSIGCAKVAATSLRRCTRGGVIVINSPLNLLASSCRESGQYLPRPLLNSCARWFLPFIVAPSATFMPLPVLPVVLLSLSCLVLHGSEGSARARTLGVHLCSTYGCSVGLWLVG